MNRGVVILISVVTLTIFVGLVNYGWQNRWGGEMDTEIIAPLDLAMPLREEKLELAPEDFDSPLWQALEPVKVPLLHQITAAPHGTNLVPELSVRAFHNGSDAYFLFEWPDDEAGYVHDTAQWPDAVAVAFSMAKEPPAASIMMGFEEPLNMWQWKANLDSKFWGGPST